MNIQFDTNKLKAICKGNGISYLGLFGSYAAGRERKNSDVDLLVDFTDTKSLLEKGKVLVELQELFNRDIDLVSRKNIKSSLQSSIHRNIITLYGEK